MIDKIKHLTEYLGFDINKTTRDKWIVFRRDENCLYEIYINNTRGTGILKKHINLKGKLSDVRTTNICSLTHDYELLYNSIVKEFKAEIRQKKIEKIL